MLEQSLGIGLIAVTLTDVDVRSWAKGLDWIVEIDHGAFISFKIIATYLKRKLDTSKISPS